MLCLEKRKCPSCRNNSIIIEESEHDQKNTPVHPGKILLEEFLEPMEISQYRISKDISVPLRRIKEIVHGKRSISADNALRLGRFFKMSPQFWLSLQTRYDLEKAEDRLEKEVRVYETGAA